MRLRYDDELVETAVFLCASGRRTGVAPLQLARFHRERERLYAILDPDERNTAFFELHLEWFREWKVEEVLIAPLKELPLLTNRLTLLAFRRSRGKSDEGAELYVNEAGERNGVVAIRTERLQREPELGAFLRHEFMHLQDMVDPEFGYAPELPLKGTLASQYRLALERYRLLWDVSIDGRLHGAHRATVATKEQRWMEFTRTFGFWPEEDLRGMFESLWSNSAPKHQDFVAVIDSARPQRTGGPRPGGACALCGFPTFAWASTEALENEGLCGTIVQEFPEWRREDGACARCADIYQRRVGLAGVV
jgi:hypothetical protein